MLISCGQQTVMAHEEPHMPVGTAEDDTTVVVSGAGSAPHASQQDHLILQGPLAHCKPRRRLDTLATTPLSAIGPGVGQLEIRWRRHALDPATHPQEQRGSFIFSFLLDELESRSAGNV